MRKAFFSVHLRSYTPKKIIPLYTHALKNSFSLYRHGLYKTSIHFQTFFFLFQYTLVVYTKNSLYTLIVHTQEYFFTHCLYTKKIFSHIFYIQKLFSRIFYIQKNSFLFFIYIYDICSQPLFLFLFMILFILF